MNRMGLPVPLVLCYFSTIDFGLYLNLIWLYYNWDRNIINIIGSESSVWNLPTTLTILTLSENKMCPCHSLNMWMESNICLHQHRKTHGQTEDNICLLYYGLFDLCSVQMGCHASWFHTANTTVTNDSGCDPMTGSFSRTNERPDEWTSVPTASVQQ